ncbi:MAG: L,D-transpeptidase family protein [Candidatus Loosdrechtia sp.]|uniref:L,D-transpeptidase family protein n=1 Tax=Candidatus Loosdrechtia sp. TaxID=3101272 RepID=UPI003A5F779D|nr:MAG: L,D-transpeptidase family protein [Candidatus Jettenia sp. AMX2]
MLIVKKDDNFVIYKKDIIVYPDELREEPKSSSEDFKPIEKKGRKKQESAGLFAIVDKYLEEGKKVEARNALSDLFINKKMPEKQNEIKELLDKLNKELIFSSIPSPDAVIYTVQPGDTLERIAKRFKTTYELIMRLNGKSTTRITVGERLKILEGNTKIIISKSDFTLTLLLNGYYIRQYKICIGKDDKTPEGIFEVKNKLKEPAWYAPQGGVFPFGHEENILGTRWIGFKDRPDASGFGIHGTTQPETIGTAASLGCIRMLNSDVEELFDFVTLDTEIIIYR